jgi:NAD(P)-dependent dehydrogenase (short-subunit alcohol dehydrogenase family)
MRHTPTMTDEEWDRDLAVNLNGPFYLCRAALAHLLESGGNIVNVSSIAGVEGEVYSAGYCAAKHGLIGLTRALAIEFTTNKLRVNAVCPGGMPTAQSTEFQAPENADWNLILGIASPRGFMETVDVAKAIAFWRATTRQPSTVRSTGSTTARVRADDPLSVPIPIDR